MAKRKNESWYCWIPVSWSMHWETRAENLPTAHSADVEYLITLDRDMLEMPIEQRRRFKFEIVTPAQFLERAA